MDYFDDSSEEDNINTPPEVGEIAREVTMNLLPRKSKVKYEKAYDIFKSWCSMKKIPKITENVLLAYMAEKSKIMKASSLWSIYSMLKTTLRVKENLEIGQFNNVIAFLKQQSVGHIRKKSKIFTKEDVQTYLLEAPDDMHLMNKVVLIFGIAGACRREELAKLTIDDVDDKDTILVVKISDTKNHVPRTFTIVNNNDCDYLGIYRKYRTLRPKNSTTNRLFIRYNKSTCMNQNVGINTFGKIPQLIAQYLKLQDPALYTGHCFRRTSATMLADAGGSMTQLKRHGGWKSAAVAESYLEDSISNKIETSKKILGQPSVVIESKNNEEHNRDTMCTSGLLIQKNKSCTFNITVINNNNKE